MLLEQNASSPPLCYQLSIMMPMLYTANAERDIRAACERIKPNVQTVIFYPESPTQMAMASVGWANTALVLIGGCSQLAHGTQYVNAIGQPINYARRGGVNPFVDEYAEVAINRCSVARILPSPRIVMVGHSMGGAAVQAMGRRLLEVSRLSAMSIITFGAPRPGPATFADQMSAVDMCRWMNDTDPVPCVPPRENQARLAFACLTTSQAANWNRYVHTAGGLQLNADGGALSRDVPEIPDVEVQMSLANWLYSVWLRVDSIHSMPYYIDRLRLRAERFPVAEATPRRTTHTESSGEYKSNREQKAAIAEAQAAVRAEAQAINNVPLVIPSEWQFSTRKIGGIWCLIWQGEVVSVGPSRRKVSNQAKAGNTFLRRLQRSANVGVDAVPLDMKRYLEAASNPEGGFNPVMRTS